MLKRRRAARRRLAGGTFLALVATLAPAPLPAAEDTEYEYMTLAWSEGTPLTQIMEFVKAALYDSPAFNKDGQVKGFVFQDDFKGKKLNFSQKLQVPIPKGASADQKARVMLSLFHTLLEISDFSLVDRGTVFEIVPGSKRQKKPIRIYTQEEAKILPAEDILVAQLYTFKNFDPGKLASVMGAFLNKQAGEEITPVLDTRTVVLTAYASKIRELYKILEIVDAATSEMAVTFVPLEHASATELEPTITQIIKAREQAGGHAGRPSPQGQGALVLANPRTNKEIIVLATPEETAEIRHLIERLDTELSYGQASVRFFQIKHRDAGEIKTLIDDLYAQRREVTQAPPAAPPAPGQPPGAQAIPLSEEARSALIAPRVVADTRMLSLAPGVAPAATDAAGTTPSGGTNMLIVIAPSERVMAEVAEIIDRVDRLKPLVLIEAIVMELGPDASREVGVELATGDAPRDGSIRGAAATGMGISTPNFANTPPTRTPGAPTGGLTAYLFKDTADRIPFILRLQETDSLTDVLACPKLLASDNETAIFTISRQEPFQRQETTSGGVITTSQAFEAAETILEFTPSISVEMLPRRDAAGEMLRDAAGQPVLEPRHYVRMQVKQKIESFKGVATFAGGTPPKESREAETTVTILNGSTVAIGGFTSKNKRATVSKVPVLGDIPILGFFFRSESTTDTMTTLFIFITPRIVDNLQDLEGLTDDFRTPEDIETLKKVHKRHFVPAEEDALEDLSTPGR